MTVKFHSNPLLKWMEHSGEVLTLQFGKYKRSYSGVPKELVYKLAYSKSASDVMSVFSNEIKNKFKVINVI